MKIAFISVRGIPNNYGGFEEFAEHISVGLARKGHEVTVYSPHSHPYQEEWFNGVRIKHIYSPEHWMGSSVGSFFYDFSSLRDALKREKYDIIYEAGYTSIIPAYMWYNVRKIKSPIFTTNMDGLEYKRTKFNKLVQKFILWEEKMAVRHSHYLVSDNMSIRDYFLNKYGKDSKYLAYGADIPEAYDESLLDHYGLEKDGYYLLIARLEPENNIEMAIEGYLRSDENSRRPLIIVGKTVTPHGKELVAKYGDEKGVVFTNGIYDKATVNALRHFSKAYFHGHSVGGTNPSLLEAMAAECFVISNNNPFNKAVLHENALFFSTADEVASILNSIDGHCALKRDKFLAANLQRIKDEYSWDILVEQHETYFKELLSKNNL